LHDVISPIYSYKYNNTGLNFSSIKAEISNDEIIFKPNSYLPLFAYRGGSVNKLVFDRCHLQVLATYLKYEKINKNSKFRMNLMAILLPFVIGIAALIINILK
jgi:hypothetical protein